MIHRPVRNGRVGVSTSISDTPLVLLQVDQGDTAMIHQWARCAMTVEETKSLIEWLERQIERIEKNSSNDFTIDKKGV
jgi:hypothetical protein